MTPAQIEEVIERTAERTAEKLREEMRGMFTALGFNMDPDKLHEEQQMVAFARTMHQGTRIGMKAAITAVATAAIGWIVWLLTNWKHP
jgi:hypothetical protein